MDLYTYRIAQNLDRGNIDRFDADLSKFSLQHF